MTFLNSPKRFVVKSLAGGALLVHESVKRATHAVLVRKSAKDAWKIFDVYESEALAGTMAEITKPQRLKEEHELRRGDENGIATMPWEHTRAVPVEGFIHPIVWHGEQRNEAEVAGLIPTQDEIPPSHEYLDRMIQSINKLRAILKLESWVIDNTAMKPGFYMLYEGNPGKKFGHPNGIGKVVEPKGMDGFALIRFLEGALHLLKEAEEITRQPTNIDLDNDELEYLRGQLSIAAPQLKWKIDQAVRQAKKKKE